VTTEAPVVDCDRRVLILVPTKKDAVLTQSMLASDGLSSVFCATVDELVTEIERGAAAILMAEERVPPEGRAKLAKVLSQQQAWSDLPILVLTRTGADSAAVRDLVQTLGNVTVLERPIRVAALTSAVRTAVRARERQYQIRGHLVDRIRAEASLREVDRRKDEFLATLGHELRNPLAPILTSLELLKLGTFTDSRALRACTVMERQVSHLVRLVDDLLEVSRITRGVVDVQKEPLDLGAVLRTAVETSRPLVQAAGQHLSIDISAEPIPIAGDTVRLTQIFANLLNNASKYTDADGRIWLTASRSSEWAVVSVRDNGIGIPPSQLTQVFDMFTQVDRSHRRAQGGLGIGLTLVRSLVSLHGGTVVARSEGPGAGSEFIVRLPIYTQSAPQQPAAERPQRFPRRRIMVVDDNREAAEALSALLTALGATVSVAYGGREALEKVMVFDPEVVLLDIGMPGMDGYEVCRQIRSVQAHAGPLLIALTGWGQDEDRERSKRAGFDHHLVKPPDIDALRSLVIDHEAKTAG
jgi:signal transduction histidine kinase/ActR/RegA family two-component response regulator